VSDYAADIMVRTESATETYQLGAKIADQVQAGDLIALIGDLGAGKTVFAQGLAHGLGVPDDTVVCSPTYTLFHQYQSPKPFLHIDLYRIGDPEEVESLGLLDELPDYVVAVEWFERADDFLGIPRLTVTIRDVPAEPAHRHIDLVWRSA